MAKVRLPFDNTDFSHATREVRYALAQAATNQNSPDLYSLFNKAAVVLLMAKLESFLESAVETYVRALGAIPIDAVPDHIKLGSINCLLDDNAIDKLRALRSSSLAVFPLVKKSAQLLSTSNPLRPIPLDVRFDYGKHGSRAINRLFRRIDIDDILSQSPIYHQPPRYAITPGHGAPLQLNADIDSMVFHRNRIVHEDQSPPITHVQIGGYTTRLVVFSRALVRTLKLKFASIQ